MNSIMNDFQTALPEIIFFIATSITLLVGLFNTHCKPTLTYWLAQLTLLISLIGVWQLAGAGDTVAFHGHYRHDGITSLLQFAILGMGMIFLLYSRAYIKMQTVIPAFEYYILVLLAILGMLVLVSAYSFLTLYLGIELLSLPIYALVALRRDRAECVEASLKYFIMGAISSGMLLYGISMVYGATGELQLNSVMQATYMTHNSWMTLGMVFIIAGIAFKLGAAPFHLWVPDVYQGAPIAITLLIASVSKIAAFGLMVRLLTEALPVLHFQWQSMLILVSLLSMALGNIVAIAQNNLRSMLAYSSIAHMGYMLLGFLVGTKAGYASAMFYMLAYTVMSLGAFGLMTMLSRSGVEIENIADLKGLNQRNPWLALIMLLVMFSMAGIPPTIGFFAKVGVLEVLIQANLLWLAVAALVFALIGAYYYIRVVKTMYFDTIEEPVSYRFISLDNRIAISINGLAILLLGIFPGALFNLCLKVFN